MAFIHGISCYLPENVLSNEQLMKLFPEWSVDKIASKTGIRQRHIAATDEYVSDMAVKVSQKLFEEHRIDPSEVAFVLLCTQSPDYFLPTTACLVQHRLGIPVTAGALDYNLGCSGYVYGLSIAKGIIASGDAENVLLITAETYSKYLGAQDKGVRTIFGDAAAATFIRKEGTTGQIAYSVFGTDGSGAENLMVKNGALRHPATQHAAPELYMNGPDIFTFTLKRVPGLLDKLLVKNNLRMEEVDLFIFHQANKYMLEHLISKMDIPAEKCFLFLENCGNTVSSTIPIAMKEATAKGVLKKGMTVLLAGFGVGYSWGGTILKY